jgi:hypothetical protein
MFCFLCFFSSLFLFCFCNVNLVEMSDEKSDPSAPLEEKKLKSDHETDGKNVGQHAEGSLLKLTTKQNWWDNAFAMDAQQLRRCLLGYSYGDIRTWIHGEHDFAKRPPRIAFVGDGGSGKSSLINSLIASWEGPDNLTLCTEYAFVGSREHPGTIIEFDGPFNLLERRKKRVVIEMFDTRGLNLGGVSFKVEVCFCHKLRFKVALAKSVEDRTQLAIDIARGAKKPGAWKNVRPAMKANGAVRNKFFLLISSYFVKRVGLGTELTHS